LILLLYIIDLQITNPCLFRRSDKSSWSRYEHFAIPAYLQIDLFS
jgi:hypothetical protein